MSKHTYLTAEEFMYIKGLLNSHKHTQREVAFKTNRSDWVVQNVQHCLDFPEYRERFQGKRYPQKKIEYTDMPHFAINEESYIITDVMKEGHWGSLMERLDKIERLIDALGYLCRK